MSIKDIVRSFSDERWCIGFVENSLDGILAGEDVKVRWVNDRQRNRWFADPFVLSADKDEIVVLCEEMCFDKAQHKCQHNGKKVGRISKVVVDRHTFEIKDVVCLLELDTHLSFPAYYRDGDGVYVYPENSESGGLMLYRYDINNDKFESVGSICNEPVADAVMTDVDGRKLMFCTRQPDPNGCVLHVYEWNGSTGVYNACDVYSFDENIARMSGNFFKHKGKLYRPTQESNVQYGHAVTIQEVSKKGGSFSFKEIRRIYSNHPFLKTGFHTFNVNPEHNLIVVDALGFDRMWFRKLLKFFGILK